MFVVIKSANIRPEPQAIVQPNVPWPVFNHKFSYAVAPTKGVLSGVDGRNPHQKLASLYRSEERRVGKECRYRSVRCDEEKNIESPVVYEFCNEARTKILRRV